MLIIRGGTLRDRVVTQARRQGPAFLLGQRVQDAFRPGLRGQDAFDGAEGMGAEADRPVQGG